MNRHRSLRTLALGLLLSWVHIACDAGEPDAPPVARTDSAGREIVTSSGPILAVEEMGSVSPAPVLSIGEVDGDDAYNLFRVSDVMRLEDGRIVVANGGTREVRLFDAEGAFVTTVGGPGQGPGEFQYPSRLLRRPEGGFTVVDFMDLEHFGDDGSHEGLDAFDRAAWMEITEPLGPSEGGTPLGDGRVLAPIYGPGVFNTGDPRPGPPYRPEITVVMVDTRTGSVDTLGHIGGIRQQLVDVGERVRSVVGPHAPSGSSFVGRDGSVVIYDGARAEVERISPDGTHRILRWSATPEPITDAEFEAWKELQRNASWAQNQLPELERGWAAMDPPTEKAVVTDARPSLDGSTWVRTGRSAYEATEPVTWQVFAPDGAWLGPVDLPAGFTPFEIGGDYLLGVERDLETEIEIVRMFALTPFETR